jgi:pilus assembly protein CpaC
MAAIAPHTPLKGKTMKARIASRFISAKLLSVAALALPLAMLPGIEGALAQSVTSPARAIALSIGRGQLITLPSRMADVFVANDTIADVQVKSTNQLFVFGKSGGETTVYASNSAGDVIWSANVRVGTNIDSVEQMLRLAMPDAKIVTSTMNSTVLLTGTVAAPEDAAEAERLVKAFVGDKINVVSRLKMSTPLQISLHVKFAEVSRTLVREIGANMTTADQTSGFKFGVGQGRAFYPQYIPGAPMGLGTVISPGVTTVTPVSKGTTLALAGKLFGLDMLGALDLGESVGLVTSLAEPNLTALSGETAEFLAGGEYPIPISQGLGVTTIEYKKYGVSLSYTPTVLANGRISIRVRPEVSELTSDGSITTGGVTVPALTVRRAETSIELGSGQSFMIAGLLRNNSQDAITKLPGAGDLPILGSLFRSTAYRKGETELVIVVTPYLVNPVDASEIKLPTDGFRAPTALQQLLGNLDNDGISGGARAKPSEKPGTAKANPKVGLLDEPRSTAPETAPAVADVRRSAKPRSQDRQAIAATPGFSLK